MTGLFTESKHPRAHGKFAHVASGDVGSAKAAATKGGGPAKPPDEMVKSNDHGMHYSKGNDKIVAAARKVSDEKWDLLPVQSLPAGTPIQANEEELKKKHIDKVVSGAVPFREGYVTKMWRQPDGSLHVVDGHHRVAMYAGLKKDMPVRIMDARSLAILKSPEAKGI